MGGHAALLGDSIFDNSPYTRGEPDVVSHLRPLLPEGWSATLLAVDGATTAHLGEQVRRVTEDMDHLVISIGGNDALGNTDLLNTPVSSTLDALDLFAERVQDFEADYRDAVAAALELRRDTTICTIYNGDLTGQEARVARVALMLFNDVIVRFAVENGLRLIDLRLVCSEACDYANPIEPSGSGGLKIAHAITTALEVARPARVTRVYS
jgi:hypothetical protein